MILRKQGHVVAAAVLVASFSTIGEAAAAPANGMGEQTQLILSADRLVPLFSYARVSETRNEGAVEVTDATNGSSSSLLWGGPLSVETPHTVPRVAFDFSIGHTRLTLGGSVVFGFGLGGSTETERVQNGQVVRVEVDSPKKTVIGVAPRVGYILPLGEYAAFWPRGGFAFYSVRTRTAEDDNANNTNTLSDSVLSLDIDPQFAIIPTEHVFFNVGPIVNIPLSGSRSAEFVRGATTTTVERDVSYFQFGITAGIGGWFNL